MTSSSIPAARSQYLLGLLAQVPDPRKRRGRRHPLAGLLAFALTGPDRLDQVPGAWLRARAAQVSGRLVIAAGGTAVRGARNREGTAPHLVAALAHGIGIGSGGPCRRPSRLQG
jgi:hypothetical protein